MNARDRIVPPYLKVCQRAAENDDAFRSFKIHPHYRQVLEHLSPGMGQRHWENINHSYFTDEAMDAFLQNDRYGSPRKFRYGMFAASPTTIQYISVLSNLITRFGSLQGYNIVAIGDGYGGQCKIIQDMFALKSYTSIDLPEAIELQKKYLAKFGIGANMKFYSSDNYPASGAWDLVISNYALSEIPREEQLKYVKDICMNSKVGYLTCNQPLNGLDLLKEKYNVIISPDIKGEREENYLVTWE